MAYLKLFLAGCLFILVILQSGAERAGVNMLQRLAELWRRPRAAPLAAAAVRCVSSGSVDITVPLNFWAGQRRTVPGETCNKEKVYEPATGKLLPPDWTLVIDNQ